MIPQLIAGAIGILFLVGLFIAWRQKRLPKYKGYIHYHPTAEHRAMVREIYKNFEKQQQLKIETPFIEKNTHS